MHQETQPEVDDESEEKECYSHSDRFFSVTWVRWLDLNIVE